MVFDWGYTFSLFLDPDLWKGAGVVVALAVLSWTIANVAGIGLALMRESRKRALNVIAGLYIWLFRSLPLLVLLVFAYNIPQVFPASQVILGSSFNAALIAMVLNEGAYMAEIVRGGILSVDHGQSGSRLRARDAALRSGHATFRGSTPSNARDHPRPQEGQRGDRHAEDDFHRQRDRIAQDLLFSAQLIYSRTYQVMTPLLIVACLLVPRHDEHNLSVIQVRARTGAVLPRRAPFWSGHAGGVRRPDWVKRLVTRGPRSNG